MLDQEDSADEDFWNQDFFAEEQKEAEYTASESEKEDVPDSDFSDSVSSYHHNTLQRPRPSCLS